MSIAAQRTRPAGFDFTGHMRRLCADFSGRLAEFSHIDLGRVAVTFRQTRKPVSHGIYATLTPLRFEGGSLFTRRRGRRWTIQRLYDSAGQEMLYILSFYLPRFMNCPLQEKLTTVAHELWHISPSFDGDLRRHPGRCYAHTARQEKYDAEMRKLADKWLALDPPPDLYQFLGRSFSELVRAHGGIYGARVRHPRLIPAPEH